MKFVNYLKYSLLGAAALLLGGCADDTFHINGEWDGTIPDELTMALVIPDHVVINLNGRAGEEPEYSISSLNAIFLDQNNNILKNEPLNSYTIEGGIITVTTPVYGGAKKMQIIVNAPEASALKPTAEQTATDPKSLADIYTSTKPTDLSPVLWGEAEIEQAAATRTMQLVRNTAKLTVKFGAGVDPANFDIHEIGLFGTANEGSLAPGRANLISGTLLSDKPTTRDETTYHYLGPNGGADELMQAWDPDDEKTHSITGIFETPAVINHETVQNDSVRLIIHATYRNAIGSTIPGYYVATLKERLNNNADPDYSETPGYFKYGPVKPILRNHEYIVTITDVRSEGWPSLNQALIAMPDNRITCLVTDVSPSITDIEATRDYYLGVGADVVTDYTGSVTIDVATTYPGLTPNPTWNTRLILTADDGSDWIHAADATLVADASSQTFFRINIPLDQNTSPEARYGYITVRAGKLHRDISITQEGFPYSRQRAITINGVPGLTEDNYFSWIEGTYYNADGVATGVRPDSIKGLTRLQNRGANRIGLHFPVVPLYTASYQIPAVDGDVASLVTGGNDFSVIKQGSNWVVTARNPETPKSATGRLRIVAKAGDDNTVNIEYDLFRTGIFHELKADYAQYQAPSSEIKTGWYYYGVVSLKGGAITLDRDLGASSNQPYAPGSSDYKNNTEAIGAYFKPNTGRWPDWIKTDDIKKRLEDQQTICAYLGLNSTVSGYEDYRFITPKEQDILNWDVDPSSVTTANTIGGRVTDNKIYFSKSGYYEGEDFKSSMHVLQWTRTYLGGTQGMSYTAADYGYWYRYYDDMKSTNPENRFSNIRMARGSGGNAPTASSVWRYMPVRPVWVNGSAMNVTTAGEEHQTITGKMIIYLEDAVASNLWDPVYIHYWHFSNGTTDSYNLPRMEKVAGQANLWRYEINGYPQETDAGLLFASVAKIEGAGNAVKTGDYKNLLQQYNNGRTVLYLKRTSANGVPVLENWSDEDIFGGGTNNNYTYRVRYNTTGYKTMDRDESGRYVCDIASLPSNSQITIQRLNNGVLDQTYYTTLSGTRHVTLGTEMNSTTSGTDLNNCWVIPNEGSYTFSLDVNANPPKLTVTETQRDYDYWLHGKVTGTNWNIDAAIKFDYDATNKVYKLTGVDLVAGEFGIGRTDYGKTTLKDNQNAWWWSSESTTNLVDVELGKAMNAVIENNKNGKNWNLTATGTFDVTFNPTAGKLTITKDNTEYDYVMFGYVFSASNTDEAEAKMTKQADGTYKLTRQKIYSGDFRIKALVQGTTTRKYNIVATDGSNESRDIEIGGTIATHTQLEDSGIAFYARANGYFDVTYNPNNNTIRFDYNLPASPAPTYTVSGTIFGTTGTSYTDKATVTEGNEYVLANVDLTPGEFVIRRYVGDYWSGDFYGTKDNTLNTTGSANTVVLDNWKGSGSVFKITTAGTYTIRFNPSTMKLTVTKKTVAPNSNDYYLHGEVWDGSWNASPRKFQYNEATGLYELLYVDMVAGAFGIQKKAVNGSAQLNWLWSADSNHNVVVGTAMKVGIENQDAGANWNLTQKGTYNVVLDPVAKTLTFTKLTLGPWTLYLTSNQQPYLYVWKDNAAYNVPKWPGKALDTQVINGTTYYVYTLPGDFDGLKFTNADGNKETGEIYKSMFAPYATSGDLKGTVTYTDSGVALSIIGPGKP